MSAPIGSVHGHRQQVRIPRQSCHLFHMKVATDSTQNLPLIP
jgi:hypothetical protein